MNLFELFVKIGVDDQASGKLKDIGDKLGNGLKTAAKIGTAAVGAAAAGVAALTTQAVNSFAEYEQLAGGAQKIFDQMDYSKIATDANNAYKELGLSANQYLAVINDVGATFAATMGDEAGYEAAKTGLKAISDYASGTGKNVDELSQKFTLITRSTSSYQSIADQFSGILPATSDAFLEQAQAAGILSDNYTKLTEVPIDEYQAAVSQMLQQGVTDLGLANNTMNEAFSTLSGSLSMAKGAWSNLVTGLADDSTDLDMLIGNFVESVGAVAIQLIPKIGTALNGASKLIESVVPVIIEQIPNLVEENLPTLLNAAVGIIEGLADGILSVLNNDAFLDSIINIILQLVNVLTNPDMIYKLTNAALKIIVALGKGLIVAIPEIIKNVPQIIAAIVSAFRSNSGEFSNIGRNIIEGIRNGISNAWNNLVSWFRGLFGDLIGIAKRILGIASPSKVFKEIGGFTAEGFGAGFEDEFAHVKGDMEDALNFDDASVGINASIRKVGAGAAGGAFGGTSIGNITINVDGAKYSDEQSLASAIAMEIQNMTDRRAAVYA